MNAGFLFSVLSFWLGAIIGSFLNVVVWRVPRGESLVRPGSHCPKCGHAIRAWENIPIISWLCLGARCSGCHQPISWKYPAGEAACGMLFAAIFHCVYRNVLPFETLLGWWWLAGTMLSAARIDAEKRIIPNLLTYTGAAAALILAAVFPLGRPAIAAPENLLFGSMLSGKIVAALSNVGGAFIGSRLAAVADCLCGMLLALALLGAANWAGSIALKYWRNRKGGARVPQEPLGFGDIKLLAMCGAFLGPDACVYLLAGGTLTGFAGCLLWLAWQEASKKRKGTKGKQSGDQTTAMREVPFAPFLAVPTLLWIIGGNWLYLIYNALQ